MPLTGSSAPQLAGSGVSAGGHMRLLQSHCEYPLTVYLCSLHGGQLRVWEQQQAVAGHLLSLGICHTVALQHGITGWRCRHRTCLILVTARWSQVIVPFPGSFAWDSALSMKFLPGSMFICSAAWQLWVLVMAMALGDTQDTEQLPLS